ncbi:MAG TPA: ABC transporter ATP-binding protein [Burkholderiales bacterium]|nr:ABC transporter ATP-binding protein [Burkholderiales bacterium]
MQNVQSLNYLHFQFTMLALEFKAVAKSFARVTALSKLDLDVPVGSIFALVGINGAGKTTLMKCLLDFCDLDSGHIEIFGVSHRVPHARSRLSFLPERFNPPFYLTGRDFLRYLLKLHGRGYYEAETDAMLEDLNLDRRALKQPVREYSKGMTQKLGLAACFLAHKDLYVLDEPLSGLDPKTHAVAKQLLLRIRQAGGTVFLTSHSLADVAEICDGMALLHEGRVLFSGPPAELCKRYNGADLEQAFLQCIA